MRVVSGLLEIIAVDLPSSLAQKKMSADAGIEIVAVLLNNGTCPKTKAQILKPETVNGKLYPSFMGDCSDMKKLEMYKDQVPDLPRYINKPHIAAKSHLAKNSPMRPLPAHENESKTEGWGLTFALNHEAKESGRKPGSASWEGLANLYWWADRESGVGGMIASQILPYGGEGGPFPCLER